MSYAPSEAVIAEYRSEAEEILQRFSQNLGALEKQGFVEVPSAEILDALYRDMHTLKGSSQLFGFMEIAHIAHAIEASLEPIRRIHVNLDVSLFDALFKAIDQIEGLVRKIGTTAVQGTRTESEKEVYHTILARLIESAVNRFGAEFRPDFSGNIADLGSLESAVSVFGLKTGEPLPESQKKSETVVELKPLSQTVAKPEVKVVAAPEVKVVAAPEVKAVAAPEFKAVAPPDITQTVSTKPIDPNAGQLLQKKAEPMSELAKSEEPSTLQVATSVGQVPGGQAQPSAASAESSTVRVQVSLLDKLMNLVGEMVLVRNQVLQYSHDSDDYTFLNLSQRLDVVTSELQGEVMKTRMQPIGTILSRFQRVVRDIAKDVNKKIELVLEGIETELDRTLLEAVKDPLTHIIRNSCDHGIELPADRKKAGKPEQGTITIRAFQEGGQVVIEIRDDGKGLDSQRIVSKAIEKKLFSVERAQTLTEREISQIIFMPGFSTAAAVSELSGRGVGMDVVKTNIERVGGVIDVTSFPGKGMVIRLKIPLTLAIVPAMIVNSNGEQFAIPQIKLLELVRVERGEDIETQLEIEYLQGKPVFRLRGKLLPLISFGEVLWNEVLDEKRVKMTSATNIVVLDADGDSFGLVVDEIKDTADIVVKPICSFLKSLGTYSGATIMGDGSVALIIDVVGLSQRGHVFAENSRRAESADMHRKVVTSDRPIDSQELLFFSLNPAGVFSMPLCLVHRLEEFSRAKIELSGKQRIVRYRESILPLISLNEFLGFAPPAEQKKTEKITVVVVNKRNRSFGVEVNDIIDVRNVEGNIQEPLKETIGILGNILSGEEISVVVDVLAIIDNIIDGSDSAGRTQIRATNQGASGSHSAQVLVQGTVGQAGKGRILFAEDTIFFKKQVMKVLVAAGYEVAHAENGELALQMLDQAPVGTYQMILSDIEMPKMGGFDLALNVRKDKRFEKLPMIAITTRFREIDQKRGIEAGFNFYLEKLKADQLLETVAKVLK